MSNEDVKKIMECMDNSFITTIESIKKEIIRNVNGSIYNIEPSSRYDRTGQFVNAIANSKYSIDNNWNWYGLFYNKSYVRSSNGASNKFGHHKSFPWDEPDPDNDTVKTMLPLWLSGGFQIFKKYHEGYHFYPYDFINKHFRKGKTLISFVADAEKEYVYDIWIDNFIKELKKKNLYKYIDIIIDCLE